MATLEDAADHAAETAEETDHTESAALTTACEPLGTFENMRQAFAASIPQNEAALEQLRADVAALEVRRAAGEAVEQEIFTARARLDHDAPILDYLIDQARNVVASCERSADHGSVAPASTR